MEYKIYHYQTITGKRPFSKWLNDLSDRRAQATINFRLEQLKIGNFGKCSTVGEGVFELKIDMGPGYRLYFSQIGLEIVLLLCGGDKKSQRKDIAIAKKYYQDYKTRISDFTLQAILDKKEKNYEN